MNMFAWFKQQPWPRQNPCVFVSLFWGHHHQECYLKRKRQLLQGGEKDSVCVSIAYITRHSLKLQPWKGNSRVFQTSKHFTEIFKIGSPVSSDAKFRSWAAFCFSENEFYTFIFRGLSQGDFYGQEFVYIISCMLVDVCSARAERKNIKLVFLHCR